jgi:hypothetical protein
MRFGGSQLPIRLRVARTILYCQAAIMVLIAALALEVLIIGGASTGVSLTGVVDKQALTGSGVTALALVLLVIGIVLVVVEQQVAARGASARRLLAVAEVALAVYLIGFVTNSVETWVFGPACGAAILILHYWPELHSYFFASDSATPASAVSVPPAPAALPDLASSPSAAAEPNSDATARPNL